MKKLLLTLCLALGVAQTSLAHAETTGKNFEGPALCGMSFDIKGGGFQVLLGKFVLKGKGMVRCEDIYGNIQTMPVEVRMGGHSPVALQIAMGYLHVAGLATGLGYARSPEAVLGEYFVATAAGAVFLGSGGSAAFHAKRRDAATINVKANVEHGFGFNVGFTQLSIRPLR